MNDASAPSTAYARLSPLQARSVLIGIVLTMAAGVAVTFSPLGSTNLGKHPDWPSDVALYRAEVDRIAQGESYYQAAAAELTSHGYPTRSVFNWRTPLPMWLLGKLPTAEWGKALLGALALAVLLMTFDVLMREERNALARPIAVALLMTGALLPAILGDIFVMPVIWAGVLIALSVCCYGIDRPRLGALFGLAAIFFRELAMPYCAICVGLAWKQRRWRELTIWGIGLTAWAVFFAVHAWQVGQWIAPDARAHRQSWVQFGGAGFVISTVQMNAYLLLLPQWVSALYLVAALIGFAGWNSPLGIRVGLASILFLLAFAVVGHSFNQYWGSMIAPLLCFGAGRFPSSARDLWKAAFHR